MIANMLEGMEHEEAARMVGLSRSAAYEWHNRSEEDGIQGLRDRRRPGRPPRVDAVTTVIRSLCAVGWASASPAQ